MAHKGYELFMTEPDTVDEMTCKVCGSICDVKRGVNGPTSFGEAMGKGTHLHDRFDCPDRKEKWHEQALELFQEMEKNPSPSLKKIMGDDLKEIVKKKKVIGEWRKSFI